MVWVINKDVDRVNESVWQSSISQYVHAPFIYLLLSVITLLMYSLHFCCLQFSEAEDTARKSRAGADRH